MRDRKEEKLRAQAEAREVQLDAMDRLHKSTLASVSALHARIATLEAPPVVPRGWRVYQENGRWYAHLDGVDWWAPQHPATLRALAWAIETGKRPPHEDDGIDQGSEGPLSDGWMPLG